MKALPFTLSAATFVIGAVILVAALRGRQYGNLGSTPDMWLVKGRIDGNDASLARMRAYLVQGNDSPANFPGQTSIRLVQRGDDIIIGHFASSIIHDLDLEYQNS